MKCPKCGYVSFEYLETCKKCSKDLFEFKEKAGILVLEPAYLDLNRTTEGQEADETESEDLKYDGDAEIAEDSSDVASPLTGNDILDSLELGEGDEEALALGGEADGESLELPGPMEGPDLIENEGLSVALDADGDESSLEAADESVLSEASAPGPGDAADGELMELPESMDGLDLTEDEDEDLLGDFDADGDVANADADAEEKGLVSDQEPALEIELLEDDKGDSPEVGEASPPVESEAKGDIEFSLDSEGDEGIGTGDFDLSEDISEADGDITGEIDLMLEDIEDLNPDPS